ncbi:MAG: hypothetical protein H8D27_06215 [Chlorobium phaeobacteroides]|uniref:Uncharacterized protein n=1 Tax=Chlorobium phaeobacteroides (strain BS1) TaxID=331678 RepID=B3EKX6_CHLPB|nr:hypothetical protein [Chlorobium phaeobacteroides]
MKGINFAIAMGIAVLLPMLVLYGVNTFSPPPEWEDFHSRQLYEAPTPETITPEEKAERLRLQQEASEKMEAARKQYQMRLFFTAVPVGLIAIIAGTFIRIPALAPGMVFGGVFTLIEGYLINWQELSDPIKFVSLLIALIILAVTASRRLASQEKT